jgi:hypothetical protein
MMKKKTAVADPSVTTARRIVGGVQVVGEAEKVKDLVRDLTSKFQTPQQTHYLNSTLIHW